MSRVVKWFYNLKIANKIRLIILLTTLTALLITAVFLAVNTKQTLQNSLIKRLVTESDIIAVNSTAALSFRDNKAATENLMALTVDEHVIAAAIFQQDGGSFAVYPRLTEAIKKYYVTQGNDIELIGRELFVKRPIMLDEQEIGCVVVQYSLDGLQQEFWFSFGMILLFLFGAAVAALLLATLLPHWITKPIQSLDQLAQQVAKKQNFSLRAERHGGDEVGSLTDHFNEMLHQIQLRDERLANYNLELEQIVAKRTEQLQQLNQKLVHQTQHDVLTGLPNRALFEDRLDQAIANAIRNQGKVALLFVDIDYFKSINDRHGHEVGDRVLLQFANRLKGCVRESDTVARFAGDEFILIMPGFNAIEDVSEVAKKITRLLKAPIRWKEQHLKVTASVGVAVFPDDEEDSELLKMAADAAMYQAKNLGRNRYQFYSSTTNEQVTEKKKLMAGLKQALVNDELVLFFQPVVNIHTEDIYSLETLLRWEDPCYGLIAPDKFLPLAEEMGLITEIDRWVLLNVLKQNKEWLDKGSQLPISINLVRHDFCHTGFFDLFDDFIRETRQFPENISIEIKEDVLTDDSLKACEKLGLLKKCGMRLSVDDYGSGYSSLTVLQRNAIDFVKIGPMYFQDPASEENKAMIRAIIAMAGCLNFKVIAVGVETQQQLDFIQQAGIDLAQGYYFYKPLSRQDVEKLIF